MIFTVFNVYYMIESVKIHTFEFDIAVFNTFAIRSQSGGARYAYLL